MRDFHEEVIKFSLKPCEKCEVRELIPSPRSGAAGVQSLEERVDEGCFGDSVASAGLDVLGAPLPNARSLLPNACSLFPNAIQPGSVSFRHRRRERGWSFH